MKSPLLFLMSLVALAAGAVRAEAIGEVDTAFKLIGPDTFGSS
jgi:catabolite regulation protein CreA